MLVTLICFTVVLVCGMLLGAGFVLLTLRLELNIDFTANFIKRF